MPTYQSPGVYTQEIDSGSRPIEGVGTAVAAFVGLSEKGPFNEPTLVSSWPQFNSTFGGFVDTACLARSVFAISGEKSPQPFSDGLLGLVSRRCRGRLMPIVHLDLRSRPNTPARRSGRTMGEGFLDGMSRTRESLHADDPWGSP
ncbi:hypothetical protein EP51_39110 (plasmid) [Rhodococcus opacus]|uniref:Uncharacterized protein n=1 Tax=Rhodococcus opacus TaxID=37919 RepID=A0A076EX20_RHOOP|nr:hypothetical protein EP51_39110 [Rhodococcus opacus]